MTFGSSNELGYKTKFETVRVFKAIVIFSLIMAVGLFVIIPKVTNKHTIDNTFNHALTIVDQMNITRNYLKYSVSNEKELNDELNKLSSEYFKATNIKVEFFGLDSVIDSDIFMFINANPTKVYKKIITDKEPRLIIAKQQNKYNVIKITLPIHNELDTSHKLTTYILIFILTNIIGLIVYYLYIFKRYEDRYDEYSHELKQKIIDEIAKNVKKEKQLAQTAKSAAMGEMMAAIIHQWKQPINAISVANSSLELEAEFDTLTADATLKHTAEINTQLMHMTETMDSFRNFFKPSQMVEFSIYDTVKKAQKLVGKILAEHITINVKVEKDVITSGFPNEFIQVLINILNNARDVILDKRPANNGVDITIFEEDGKAVLTICDYAGGVPPHIIDKIFEPYITTKSDNKGTGIGLDMSKTIIEKSDGQIYAFNKEYEINKEKIRGACFKIVMPLKEESSQIT
jgi:signal transduction histidine kinase